MALPDVAKRQAFVRHYVVSGNATRAAIAVGCSPKLASVTASRWLRNGDVLALLRKQIDLYLRDLIPGALNALRQLVESKETPPATRLAAVKDILDRVGFVPPKRPELSVQMDNIGQYKKRNWWRRRESNPRPSIRHAPATTCLVCL